MESKLIVLTKVGHVRVFCNSLFRGDFLSFIPYFAILYIITDFVPRKLFVASDV